MNPSLCSMRLMCVVAAVGLAAIPLLQVISYNNVEAQSYFEQNVLINIDKGVDVLGNYGVILSNDATSDRRTNFYIDTPNDPQIVSIPASILAFDGDTLTACAMIMATNEIACDTQVASRFSTYRLQFTIYMDLAQQVTPGFQPQEFNGYASLGKFKLWAEG